MQMFARTAVAVQGLLGPIAEEVARSCGLIRRERKFCGSSLLATFVLGFLRKPRPSWEDLAATARQLDVDVSPQAIEQRLAPALRDALRELWQRAVQCVVGAQQRAIPLLQKFTGVRIGDSTTIRLCDALAEEFPGCGGTGSSGRAALKLQVLWDVLSGHLLRIGLEAGKQNDSTSPVLDETPPRGSLSIYDLGYFSLERFRAWGAAGACWISRGFPQLTVWADGQPCDLLGWLARQPQRGPWDVWLEVGRGERLPCRLLVLRVPAALAAERRRKAHDKAAKKGRQPSRQHLQGCDWSVFLTNCPAELLTWQEVIVLYRLRWQIELLFKLWKSHHLLEAHRTDDPVRQLVELFARLTAAIVQHWLLLTSDWDDERLSLRKAARLLQEHLPLLLAALPRRDRLIEALARLARQLRGLARIDRRRARPSNFQLLRNPELLTYVA